MIMSTGDTEGVQIVDTNISMNTLFVSWDASSICGIVNTVVVVKSDSR